MKEEKNVNKVIEIDNNDILPNRYQPRKYFDEEEILQLSESIKEHGVLNPIIVRKLGDKYELVAGERRYKANILAGNDSIPSIVMDVNDKESSEIAIVENIQRKDLNSIEEAISYKRSLDIGLMTQEQLAQKMGKSQSYIANKIRLLKLSEEVQEALMKKQISDRHARSLLKLNSLSQQNKLLKRIIDERLTVRKTDEEIDKMNNNINNVNENLNQNPNTPIVGIPNTNNIMREEPPNIENNISNNLNHILDNKISFDETEDSVNNQNLYNSNNNNLVIPVKPDNSIPDIDISNVPQNDTTISNNSVNLSNFATTSQQIYAPKTNPIEEKITPIVDISPIQEPIYSNQNLTENNTINNTINNNDFKKDTQNLTVDNNTLNNFSNISDTISFNETKSTSLYNDEPLKNNLNNNIPNENKIDNELNQLMNNSTINGNEIVKDNNNNQNNNQYNNSNDNLFKFAPIIDTTENVSLKPIDNDEMSIDSQNLDNKVNNISNQPSYVTELKPEPIIVNDYNQQYDPIMPEKENSNPTIDFKSIINLIRKCSSAIENSGYKIETEEYNLDNLYQVVFKIEKKEE